MKLRYCFLPLNKNHTGDTGVNVGHNRGQTMEACQLPYGANIGDGMLYCKLKTCSSLCIYAVCPYIAVKMYNHHIILQKEL